MKVLEWAVAVALGLGGCNALPKALTTGIGTGPSSSGGMSSSEADRDAVVDTDDIRSGLETTNMLGSDPAGFRVTWIRWDSGFRGTELRIGDRIIALNGERYVNPARLEDRQLMLPRVPGGYAENQYWKDKGAHDGTEIELTVERRAPSGSGVETAKVRGRLRAARRYSEGTRRRLGPGGPESLANDGFDGSWSGWYDKQVREWEKVLDRGWTQQQVNSRSALASHLEHKARVEFLVSKYPGPFATAVKADWDRVRDSLVGRRYQVTERDLVYRQLGAQRAGEIAAAATKARDAFLTAAKPETIAAFPAVDPIRGDRKSVENKVIVLPPIGTRSWVSEGGHGYFAIGEKGWYFVDLEKPEARRMFEAQFRYQKYVTPRIDETYAVIGRIKADPKVVVVGGRAAAGFEVVPLGVTIGNALFVDLTANRNGVSAFAGEEVLSVPTRPPLADTASPREVMAAFFAALKLGEEPVWRSLYATWWAEDWKEEGVIYHPFYRTRLDEEWIRARRHILDEVYDAKVIYVGKPKKVLKGTEFPKAPIIEEVLVEVDHVGRFDGEYHAFTDINVHRVWLLQRRDGGPWRITGSHGL